MATTNRDGESHAARVRLWQTLFAGVVFGAILGIVVALLVVQGDWINFGDLPTWLLVAAAVWAGAIALRQLREQQTELSRIREHQLATDNLLALQLSEATKTAALSIRVQVIDLGKLKWLRGVPPIGCLANTGGVAIHDLTVRAEIGGELRPAADLLGLDLTRVDGSSLEPGAMAFFGARGEAGDARWRARFTDLTGQRWEIRAGGEPVRAGDGAW